MTNVWWVGSGHERRITSAEWAQAGVAGRPDVIWNSGNGWAVPTVSFTEDQLDIMALTGEFLFDQEGPRVPTPHPGSTKPVNDAGIYYAEIKRIYDELVENGQIAVDVDSIIGATELAKQVLIASGASDVRSLIGAVSSGEVTSAINAVIDAAPGTLDTLNELAAALGDDPNFAATITAAISSKADDAATTAALALKAPLANPTFTGTVNGVTKGHVGLGNVDNTSDANKPVSTAQQTALDLKANASDVTASLGAKAPLDSPAFTGTPTGITKNHVGLGNVDNTSDLNKPISTDTQSALDLKADTLDLGFDVILEGDNPLDPIVYRNTDVQNAFNARRARLGPGVYHIDNSITIPFEGSNIVFDDATIITHYTSNQAFMQQGVCFDSSVRNVTAGATKDSVTLTMDTSSINSGDWVFVASSDLQPNDSMATTAVLRQVKSVTATDITIDIPLYRNMTTGTKAVKVLLGGKTLIDGKGVIKSADQSSVKSLLRFVLTDSPEIGEGITLGPHGGPAFQVEHTYNAISRCSYYDVLNDPVNNHYGYGFNDGGASRYSRVLGGTAYKIRHAYTTNNSPFVVHSDLPRGTPNGQCGEPEDFYVGAGFTAIRTETVGFDTHEPGQRGIIEVIAIDCAIGAQNRATDTTFIIKQIVSPSQYGVHQSNLAIRGRYENLQVTGLVPSPPAGSAVIRARAPFTLVNPQVIGTPAGWNVLHCDAGADVTVLGGGFLEGSRSMSTAKIYMASPKGDGTLIETNVQTDIRAALVSLGLVPSSGNLTLSLQTGAFTAGGINCRTLRPTATAIADIPLRVTAMAGQTGDLIQAQLESGVQGFKVDATAKVTALGGLEVGHASDTTISRSSSGRISIEGNPVGIKVSVPSSSSAAGTIGDWAVDSSYRYDCIATNTWVRTSVASW